MPNPLHAAVDALTADLANLPDGSTASASFPSDSALNHPHVQVAWDGSPTFADNREDATIRVTVWTPKGQVTLAADLAEGVLARLLGRDGANYFRFDRGAGRSPGFDADTGLPFTTFTVTAVMHALTP